MEKIEVELFSDEINYVIIRTPGRQYPGMVIQGDTLRSIVRLAERVHSLAEGAEGELRAEAADLYELLRERIIFYEATLDRHNFGLPYSDRLGNATIATTTEDLHSADLDE